LKVFGIVERNIRTESSAAV